MQRAKAVQVFDQDLRGAISDDRGPRKNGLAHAGRRDELILIEHQTHRDV